MASCGRFTSSGRPLRSAPNLILMAWAALTFCATSAHAASFDFTNDSGRQASDLHVQFTAQIPNRDLHLKVVVTSAKVATNPAGCGGQAGKATLAGPSVQVEWPKSCVQKGDKATLEATFKVLLGESDVTALAKVSVASVSWTTKFTYVNHPTLSWDDFQEVTTPKLPNTVAVTVCGPAVTGIKEAVSTPEEGAGGWKATAKKELVEATAFFVNGAASSEPSWVLQGGQTGGLLKHEQGHWDCCEIFARKLIIRLRAISETGMGASSTAAHNQALEKLRAKQKQVRTDTASEFKLICANDGKYDQETDHGKKPDKQAEWDKNLAACLKDLQANIAAQKFEIPASCDPIERT